MVLLFLTPSHPSQPIYFDLIPSRAVIHGLLFWGFVHFWVCALKKQGKHDVLRRNSFTIAFAAAVIFALTAELTAYFSGLAHVISVWNLIFSVLGAGIGIISFRLLYASCY